MSFFEELDQLRELADAQRKLIATLIEDKEALLAGLRIARSWMPLAPYEASAIADCNAVADAIARAEGRSS